MASKSTSIAMALSLTRFGTFVGDKRMWTDLPLTCFLLRNRYHYEAQGSIADGELIPAALVGSKSTCPVSVFLILFSYAYVHQYSSFVST